MKFTVGTIPEDAEGAQLTLKLAWVPDHKRTTSSIFDAVGRMLGALLSPEDKELFLKALETEYEKLRKRQRAKRKQSKKDNPQRAGGGR